MLATAGVKNSPGRRLQEAGGGGWGDGKQKQQTSTWSKVKGRCQLNLSKSFMSFVDLTKFRSYKMLPENPDKILSDISSMKRKFRKGNPLFQGWLWLDLGDYSINSGVKCFELQISVSSSKDLCSGTICSIPIDSGVPEAGCGTVGVLDGWKMKIHPKTVKSYRKDIWKSSKVQIARNFGRWSRWIYCSLGGFLNYVTFAKKKWWTGPNSWGFPFMWRL